MGTQGSRPVHSGATRCRTAMFVLLICLPVGALAASTVQGTVSELPKSLAQQGWQYQSDAEGNVYYYPPQPLSTADEGKEAAVSDVAQQDISRLLLERGWMLETNAQGDTLLRPIRPPTPPDIHELLRQRGWRVLTDMDGNTLLMPIRPAASEPIATTSTAPPGHASPEAAAADPPPVGNPTDSFRQALEEKGWTVRMHSDGSMIVYPPAVTPPAAPIREAPDTTLSGYCEGITLAAEEVQLPVDSAEKARLLSTAWIANFGRANHAVGKVREVNQLFIVSIVDAVGPHPLHNQLVVREDGTIIALH